MKTEPTEPKLDRRIVKTREAINKAFLELFAERALEQITINDIADRANVNRGTVYLHYADKYDLLDRCIEEHLSQLITFCGDHDPRRKPGAMADELEPVFIYLRDHFQFFSAMLSGERTRIFREHLMQFISANARQALERRAEPREIDAELNAQFVASAFVGIMEWWIRGNMPHPPRYMAEQLWRMFEKNDIRH